MSMTRKKKHSKAEVAAMLDQADHLARQGMLQSVIARTLGVSVMTLHRWRKVPPGPRKHRLYLTKSLDSKRNSVPVNELPSSSLKTHGCGDS
jgi:DNA-binding transcriptional regulator YiaG